MPLDDLLISTGVDNLIKLVHERGRVEMRAAAGELHVPVQTIEDWSHVLESEGIIKIQYQLTQVYLVWASMSPPVFEKASKAVAAKKTETVEKLEALDQTVEKSVSELDELKGQFGELQKRSRSEMEALTTDRAEADRLAAQSQEVIGAKSARLQELRADLEKFRGEVEGFEANLQKAPEGARRAGGAAGRSGRGGGAAGGEGARDVGAQMEELSEVQGRLEEKLRATDSQFSSLEGEIRRLSEQASADKSLDELTEMKTAVEDLKFARTEMAKSADALRNDVRSLGGEIENLTERLDDAEARKAGAVSPKKVVAALAELSRQASRERESTLGELNKNLEAVRKQMQAYSQAQYQYQTIKTHLESLKAQYAKESEELEQFLSLLDGASKRYAKDLATAKTSLVAGQSEYEDMLQKARTVQGVLSQIESLRSEGEALSTKLRGVIKEAQVVALSAPASGRGAGGNGASGGGAGAGGGASGGAGAGAGGMGAGPEGIDNLPPELVQRIALTTSEEEQFEKKREELRGLIRKMWEEDRKPPNA